MIVRLVGANPCVTLYSDDEPVAFASVWQVDWSERGTGRALVLGHSGAVRVIGPDPELGVWLAETFNQHFKGVRAGLPWATPVPTVEPVEFDLDLAVGLRARAAGVTVEITQPIDHQLTRNDAYDLGGTPQVLSTVWIPCATGTITVDGRPIEGAPRVSTTPEPASTAFLADAEVWCWP